MTKKSYFISIFPEIFETALRIGITKKALINKIVDFETINPISFLKDKERLDDVPFGGGPGMLMKANPLVDAIDFCKEKAEKKTKVIYVSPQGKLFDQSLSKELANEIDLIFLCGR